MRWYTLVGFCFKRNICTVITKHVILKTVRGHSTARLRKEENFQGSIKQKKKADEKDLDDEIKKMWKMEKEHVIPTSGHWSDP